MGHKKLIRFEAIKTFPNVLQYPQGMKNKWNDFFKNDYPITLELACGKGEYAVGLGRLYPQRNFVGIDIKGNRIWKGAKTALDEGLSNVAFIRSHIDKVTDYFDTNEVDEIWVTFPDPQPKRIRENKRLTSPPFLKMYKEMLKSDGVVHLKTDSDFLYQYTLEVVKEHNLNLLISTDDLYNSTVSDDVKSIQTFYEKMFMVNGKNINYCKFQFI